ncbi:MAG: ferritin-like domain-containing protein [Solirubrobacteraceae bacterium]
MPEPDPMDVPNVLKCLNEALVLQRRSVLQLTTASGSMFGLEVQGVANEMWAFAKEELDDLRRLVEKITALGGDPGTDITETKWSSDPRETVKSLIENETETVDALHAVIPYSGQNSDSEALEHLMEHIIMRKQNQVDWMQRAIREP